LPVLEKRFKQKHLTARPAKPTNKPSVNVPSHPLSKMPLSDHANQENGNRSMRRCHN